MMVALKCLLITFTSSCAFSMMLCKNTQSCTRVSVLGENPAHYIIYKCLFVSEGCSFPWVCLFPCVCVFQECAVLSWPQRVSVVKDASEALQFLHCPPEGEKLLIHGDVKRWSSPWSSLVYLWIHVLNRSKWTAVLQSFIWHESLKSAESRSYTGLFPAGREKWLETMIN